MRERKINQELWKENCNSEDDHFRIGFEKQRMRIFHIVDSMEVGGAERLVLLMCRIQRERGHEPSVHCLLRVGVLGEELRAEGFDVRLHGPTHLPAATQRFHTLFKTARPDVVHCHNPTAAIYAAPAARIAGVPKVIATRHSLVAPPYNRLREIKFSVAARFCDSVVGVCDATVQNLSNAPLACRRNLTRIYNGALPVRSCESTFLSKKGFTLVHVGRLAQIKNQHMLLDSFAIAKHALSDLSLWIVGDGVLRSELEHHANNLSLGDSVTFFGEQTDVSPFLSAADAFIMCSKSEGLPVSLLEAMSAGLPAIVTEVGGMAEIVSMSGAGVIAPTTGPGALAEAIVALAQDKKLLSQCGKAARDSFERQFSISAMLDQYMRLYCC